MEYMLRGLSSQEVQKSRKEHGSNVITPPEMESFWDKLLDNFKDPMIVILMVALVITTILAVMGFAEWYEGVGIAVAVILATFVSTSSEYKNEQAFQKLQEEASKIKLNVFRDEGVIIVDIDDIVAGDLVLLQPGDKVPADGKIISGELKINQAMLTGEPEAVTRKECPREEAFENPRDLYNVHLVFRGSTVEDGEGVMEVMTVGDHTIYGKLAQELRPQDREGPLRVKLGQLAQDIARFGYIGGAFIACSYLFKTVLMDHHFQTAEILAYISQWQIFLYDIVTAAILAVIVIVVAVPEGLPMMVAIVLAQNMRKLLNAHVLVRQLLGIETAGSLNLLFCDKTGTITKGQLEAVRFVSGEGKSYARFDSMPPVLQRLLFLSLRENTSCVLDPSAAHKQHCIVGGNATEKALLTFVKADEIAEHYSRENLKLEKMILFNAMRKFSATQIQTKDFGRLTLVKGIPEKILDRCIHFYDESGNKVPMLEHHKGRLTIEGEEMSRSALRLIAVATSSEPIQDEDLPSSLDLIGLMGLRDEVRPESKPAIQDVQRAGVQVVMITGDKRETARAIADDAGLLHSPTDEILVSQELNESSDEELKGRLANVRVIARSLPSDKSRLVRIAQDMGYVVGMTGDGVNDAPALSKADIGFGMGSGSEVAKEASKIVILDDNFLSISQAILYGRTVYHSIQKFIAFQLTVSISAILVAFLGPFLGYNLPLTMTQLLWINLIMDTLAALAFSGEPALHAYMKEKPKDREERIINGDMWSAVLLDGAFVAAMSILFLKSPSIQMLFQSDEAFLTGFFAFFAMTHAFNTLNCRVEHMDLFSHITENKGFLQIIALIFGIQVLLVYFGGAVFRTVPLTTNEWTYIVLMSFAIIPFDLLRKMMRDGLFRQ
jgi:P-type Ca2+ transporter type 2C